MAALLRQVGSNVIRARHYVLDPATGRYVRTVLLEPAATNLLLDSCNLPASGSAWGGTTSNFVISAAASVFSGQTAWRHTNDGSAMSRQRSQTIGTLTGQPETASAIVENVDATETLLSLFDVTLQAHVCAGRLTWATGATSLYSGTGTVIAQKLANAGPNGGPVYRLMVTGTGTAGNQRRIYVYPSDVSQNTGTVIVHHVQHEVGAVATSPIVTAASTVSRPADVLTFPWAHAPGPYTGYLRFIESGAIAYPDTRALFQIGTGGTRPRLWVRQSSGQGRYGIAHELDAGNAVTSLLPASPVPTIGDQVELLWRLYADGSVQIEQAINGGAPVVAARTAAIGLPAAWSGQVMRLSGAPNASGVDCPAAWLGWAIEVGSSDATWDYMRATVGF